MTQYKVTVTSIINADDPVTAKRWAVELIGHQQFKEISAEEVVKEQPKKTVSSSSKKHGRW